MFRRLKLALLKGMALTLRLFKEAESRHGVPCGIQKRCGSVSSGETSSGCFAPHDKFTHLFRVLGFCSKLAKDPHRKVSIFNE